MKTDEQEKRETLTEKIAEVKDQIEKLRIDISIMPRADSKMLREDLRMVKDYLKRLQKKK